jgi:hypothetical protein
VATPAEVKPNIGETGMSNCEAQMSDDHLLMQDIVETCGITVKQLAAETGLAGCTIYRYLEGSATIPSVIWRKLFERTEDPRIWHLVTGKKRMTLIPHEEKTVPLGRPGLMDLIKARRHQIEFEKEVLDILEDGRIDRSDRITVEKIRQDYPKAVKAMANIYYAVVEAYEGSEGSKR